jgi:hypothetical protein
LSGRREDSAYLKFHLCVYEVLRWMRDETAAGREPDEGAALARLDEVWKARGPVDHHYESVYRQSAERMVGRWAGRPMRKRTNAPPPKSTVELPHGEVTFVPDNVEQLEDGTEVFERLRTGRVTKNELTKDIYALYAVAARESNPAAPARVQVRSLSSDTVQPVELKDRAIQARLAHYDAAIVGILQEQFPPKPDARECPRCPHYFICPLAEDS